MPVACGLFAVGDVFHLEVINEYKINTRSFRQLYIFLGICFFSVNIK